MKSKIGSLLKVLALTGLLAVMVAVMSAQPLSAQNEPPPMEEDSRMAPVAAAQKGIAYVSWWHGEYQNATADLSLENLEDTGANWMSLLTTQYQETISSTTIFTTNNSPTDADLEHVIEKAHELGLKVMLKPHLDVTGGGWRGQIGSTYTTTEQWDAWFLAYTDFITHYATMAQDLGVDQFCVGTELLATEAQSMSWRSVISAVTEIYTGSITYAANHDAENDIVWWDAVDYIGVDAYYRLTQVLTETTPTVAELKAAWTPIMANLAALSEQYDRPIIFTEIGYRSVDGVAYQPWDYSASAKLDLQEQVNAYQAMFESVFNQPWFAGLYMWSWDTNPVQGGPCDTGYTPFNKPAENILREWYGGEQKQLPGSGLEPKPDYDNALSLYSDQMDNGWTGNEAWGGVTIFTATDEVYEGNHSIRGDFRQNEWGGIELASSPALDTTPYRWLEFAVRKDQAGRELRIFAYTDENAELPKISEACYVEQENDDWLLVRVPLSMFYANDRLIGRIAVQNFTPASGTIWMDSVKLVPSAPTVDFAQAEFTVDEGAGEAVVTATLVADVELTVPFTVSYATESVSATAGSDFITSTGTLVFAPGTTEMTFTVAISDDAEIEIDEPLALILSNPVGDETIQLGSQNNPAKLIILDNDAPEFKLYLPLVMRQLG